jgi:hypothetical protein
MNTQLAILGRRINVASRSRRRQLVVLLYLVFAILLIAFFALNGSSTITIIVFLGGSFLQKLLGGRHHDGGVVPPVDQGDERDMRRRDHAYFVAYWWWDFALIPAFLSLGLKNIQPSGQWGLLLHAFAERLPWGFLVAAMILYYTLPQAILLWTEPDMEDLERSR